MKKSEIIKRQHQVWQYQIEDYDQQEIADKIGVSSKTIHRDLEALEKDAVNWYNDLPKGTLYLYHKKNVDTISSVKNELWKLYKKTKDDGKKIQILNSIAAKSKTQSDTLADSLIFKQLEYLQRTMGEKSIPNAVAILWKAEELFLKIDEFKSKCTCGAALTF